jgi:methylase of polypeptide subunit release factors
LIVANLPYIRDDDRANMSPDTFFEPAIALFGGPRTGFELYETFFRSLRESGTISTLGAACMIEFGYDQREIAGYIL